MPFETKLIFDLLTEDAMKLMGNGYYNVYHAKQENFDREAEGYESLPQAREMAHLLVRALGTTVLMHLIILIWMVQHQQLHHLMVLIHTICLLMKMLLQITYLREEVLPLQAIITQAV